MYYVRSRFILLATLTASSLMVCAYAGGPEIIPPSNAWEFYLEGFYAQPENRNIAYITPVEVTNNNQVDATTVNSDLDPTLVDPAFSLGFQVGLGYLFRARQQDIQVNYTYFNESTSSSTHVDGVTQAANALPGARVVTMSGQSNDLFNGDFVDATGGDHLNFQSIDLDFGQYVNINGNFQGRLFAGLRGARINSDTTGFYSGLRSLGNPFNETDDVSATYMGIGPRFGFDARYRIYRYFNLAGHAAGGPLAGQTKNSFDFYRFFGSAVGAPSVTQIASSDDSEFRVTWGYDAKLGLGFSSDPDNTNPNGVAYTIEAGYRVTEYFNAFSNTTISSASISNDAAFSGPYISLGIIF